jgi:peptide/nickel transport system ATP-binding protein
MADVVLRLEDVVRTFGGGRSLLGRERPAVHAVRGISLEVRAGETVGLVGESGCGKSTLARMIVGLDAASSGRIAATGAGGGRLRTQYVFQDPVASLNPRKRVSDILSVPLTRLARIPPHERAGRLGELMDLVNLDQTFLERYPHELSGGQAQRVSIARALAAEPDCLVLDEPVSALDVSMQAQILDLLRDLKARLDLTYIFISHDLAVVEAISDRVAVLYFGRIVETGPARAIFAAPQHPYTRLLMSCALVPGRRPSVPEEENAELPDPYAPPPGCAFAARCPRARDVCRRIDPGLEVRGTDPGHPAACHFPHP